MQTKSKRRILITGGSGFIGTNLVSSLVSGDSDILSCDINEPQCQSHKKVFHRLDILDKSLLADTFKKFAPTDVIHLAARTDLHEKNNINSYLTNTEGVQNMVDVISGQPSVQRCMFTSSRLVCPIDYTPKSFDDYCPNTLYGHSKVTGEKIVKNSMTMNISWCIARPTSVWGPWSCVPNNPYGKFFQMVIKGRYFHPGIVDPPRSYGYVGNTVFQINKILDAMPEQIHKKVFYLSDYQIFTIRKWADSISLKLRNKKIKTIPEPLVRCMAWTGDLMKICGCKEPPFSSFRLRNMRADSTGIDIKPTELLTGPLPYSMEQGVEQTIAWLKSQ